MLDVTGLNISFDQQDIIKDFNLKLAAGEQILIIGPSGCGKTILLHSIAGLLKPSSGAVNFAQQDIYQSADSLLKHRKETTKLIFQNNYFATSLSVIANLELALFLSDKKLTKTSLLKALKEFGLEDKADSKISNLSSGEAQRINILRAVLCKPKLLLADEPTAHLDDNNAEKTIKLLINESKKINSSLITVTHDARIKPYFKKVITL